MDLAKFERVDFGGLCLSVVRVQAYIVIEREWDGCLVGVLMVVFVGV